MILSKFDYDWKPIVFPKELFDCDFEVFMKHVLKELNKYGEYGWKCNVDISSFEEMFKVISKRAESDIEISYLFVRETTENVDDLIQTVHHNACTAQMKECINMWGIDMTKNDYPDMPELNTIKKKK